MTQDIAAELSPLTSMAKIADGREAYYRALTGSDDNILRVAAWAVLLELGTVRDQDHAAIVQHANHGAVRKRAFAHYSKLADRARSIEVARVDLLDNSDIEQRFMLALQNGDHQEIRDAYVARFLLDGDLRLLRAAADAADSIGGWRTSVVWHARTVALNPTDLDNAASLANLLLSAHQTELLHQCLALMGQSPTLKPVDDLFHASLKLSASNAAECLSDIAALEERGRASPYKFTIGAAGLRFKAQALAKLGRGREAHQAFVEMHKIDAASFPKPALFVDRALRNNHLTFDSAGPVTRTDCVMMLGFPRSGTTLLENALAAHPRIETFEEIPSLEAAVNFIELVQNGHSSLRPGSVEAVLRARESYYGEIERHRKKQGAAVLVDKMPIRSINAPLLERLFPGQRYIFSIRHPYDVALSCFQQRFKPNSAMASFLAFGDTVRLYDVTMTTWFSVHSIDDSNVHYVRYNQLVNKFEERLRKSLEFLGLDWDGAVMDFAERADSRATRTPSYQKVRQGLSIGVQTHWKNYEYLFKAKEAEPLTKWAKFFGYETV